MSIDQKLGQGSDSLTLESVAAAMRRPYLLVSFDEIDAWYRCTCLLAAASRPRPTLGRRSC